MSVHKSKEDIETGKDCSNWRERIRRIITRKTSRETRVVAVYVIEGDAAKAHLSEGTVYYLFKPFGEKTV